MPNITNVAKAGVVGKKVFTILERVPKIENNAIGDATIDKN